MAKTHFQVAVERLGPNPTIDDVKHEYVAVLIDAGIPHVDIASTLGVSLKTAYNWVHTCKSRCATGAKISDVLASLKAENRDLNSLPSSI